jgi:hypothetical protein
MEMCEQRALYLLHQFNYDVDSVVSLLDHSHALSASMLASVKAAAGSTSSSYNTSADKAMNGSRGKKSSVTLADDDNDDHDQGDESAESTSLSKAHKKRGAPSSDEVDGDDSIKTSAGNGAKAKKPRSKKDAHSADGESYSTGRNRRVSQSASPVQADDADNNDEDEEEGEDSDDVRFFSLQRPHAIVPFILDVPS